MTEYAKCPKCGGDTLVLFMADNPGHKETKRRCLHCAYGYIVHVYRNMTGAGKLPVGWGHAVARKGAR